MKTECKCPECKQAIEFVYCYNCGEEIEVYKIINPLNEKERALLKDILGHVNYDKDESEVFNSLYDKLVEN